MATERYLGGPILYPYFVFVAEYPHWCQVNPHFCWLIHTEIPKFHLRKVDLD